jgi:hypothetical protein
VRVRLVLSSDDRSNVTGCVRFYGLWLEFPFSVAF